MSDHTRITLSDSDRRRVEAARELLVEVRSADLSDAPYSLGRLEIVTEDLLRVLDGGQS